MKAKSKSSRNLHDINNLKSLNKVEKKLIIGGKTQDYVIDFGVDIFAVGK